ncbi:MAG TPA: ABC transporter substrate-binding protein [Chloroflexota bacterium]|nr:ABC transporter substrate-binding protein [Chloroflexota bacterium]
MSALSRRQFLKTSAGAAALLSSLPLLAACGGTAASSGPSSGGSSQVKSVNIMMNGGMSQENWTKAVLTPFQQKTGVTINVIPSNSAPMLTRVRAERNAPTIDAVVWDDPIAVQARDDNLVEKINPANVPNLKDLAEWADYKDGYGPAVYSNPSIFAYNPAHFKLDGPQSYKDMWDPKYAKGFDLPSVDVTQGVQFLVEAGLLNGGSYDDIEPAFAAMKKLQPNIGAYYHDVSQIQPALKDDPYVMFTGTGQIHAVIDQGIPLKTIIPAEGAMATPAVFDIIKGTKAKDLLEQLLNAYLDPTAQLAIAKAQYWAMPNTKIQIPPELKDQIPTKVITFDARKIAAHQQEWSQRAKREIET